MPFLKSKTLFILILLTVVNIGCKQDNWKLLNREDYEIKYPATWAVKECYYNKPGAILYCTTADTLSLLKTNVTIIVEDLLNANLKLDQCVNYLKKRIEQGNSNVEYEKSQRQLKNNKVFHNLVYTARNVSRDFRCVVNIWLVEDKVFMVSFISEIDRYSVYQDEGEEMLNSFFIKYDPN